MEATKQSKWNAGNIFGGVIITLGLAILVGTPILWVYALANAGN